MIKLSSLNSDGEFKKLLRLKKISNNNFTIYFGKIYFISYIEKFITKSKNKN